MRHVQQECSDTKVQLRQLTIDPTDFEQLVRKCDKLEHQLQTAQEENRSQKLRADTNQKQLAQERHDHIRTKRHLDRAKQITDGEIERRKAVERKLKDLQVAKPAMSVPHQARTSSQGMRGARKTSRSNTPRGPLNDIPEPAEEYAEALLYQNPAPNKARNKAPKSKPAAPTASAAAAAASSPRSPAAAASSPRSPKSPKSPKSAATA